MSGVDVIVTMTTPPLLGVVGGILQRCRGAKHYIWAMDLFPEALADLDHIHAKSWIARILYWISDWSYASTEGIIVIGECMRRRLLERAIPERKLHVAENWADGNSVFPIARSPEGPLVLLYSGNLGLSHDVDTILFAIEALKNDVRFQFRFVGGGPRQKQIQDFCLNRDVQNVSFLSYCPREQLSESLSEADIGLVTQRPTCAGSVVPSKVYGLMAAGRPLLYVGPRNTTMPFWIIERFQCGWLVDCGDGPGLVALLNTLHERRDLVRSAGLRAREAFLSHYDMPQSVARICSLIGAVDISAAPRQVNVA